MSPTSEAYAWVWLPGAVEPVVAGLIQRSGGHHRFAYARSYLERPDAISLYEPELPLRSGWIDPSAGLTVAGALRDAAPDAWGQRVILQRLFGDPDADAWEVVDVLTFLLESASDRIGGLDFQTSPAVYAARGGPMSLEELHRAAIDLAEGRDLSPEAAAALVHGTSVGGARPKLTVEGDGRSYVAKLSVSTDPYPVVKAEAVGLDLARRVGIEVPHSRLTRSLGHDVLLVERFDRPGSGRRRLIVSGLTMVALDEMSARWASYPDMLDVLRRLGTDEHIGARLFERIVFNIAIGNNDDHARNHSAFWDGAELTLTPAYDLCPQNRTGETSNQAMAIDRDGRRESTMRRCVESAHVYGLDRGTAIDVVARQIQTIGDSFEEVADANELTRAERNFLLGRQIINPSVLYDLPRR